VDLRLTSLGCPLARLGWCVLALACAPATLLSGEVDRQVLAAQAERTKVVDEVSKAAVAIFSPSGEGGGSGVVISPDGYALSNFHVTAECGTAMKCGMVDGQLHDAVIVGIDPVGDVALIKLLGREDFPHAELGDSDRVQVGDWCFVVGNPFLLATDFHPSVTYGLVSGVHRYQYPAGTLLEYTDCLQADAAINPGNSGGPMFDAEGKLIGVNGRGSFEKRGRVNVGVGYAISINQIKNFLGHLRSGRVVDHATLGATVSNDEQGRVVVDDILDQSDAFRRGLRYGDEIVALAGRAIPSPNALKNVLGIFPKGWRIPLSFRRKGVTFDTHVRLRGVHGEAELAEMLARPTEKTPPGQPKEKPGQPAPDRPDGTPELPKHPVAEKEPLPKIVEQHFKERVGYANHYFNKVAQDRVWNAMMAGGQSFAIRGPWKLAGKQVGGRAVVFVISDQEVSMELSSGRARIGFTGSLAESLDPPGSGGLLVALGCWRRLLVGGPEKFGQVHYLGTAPLTGRNQLFDVLVGVYRDVECHFMFDPADGHLAALEMFSDDDADPCEIYFSDYRPEAGTQLPHQLEVRYGDATYQVWTINSYELTPTAERP